MRCTSIGYTHDRTSNHLCQATRISILGTPAKTCRNLKLTCRNLTLSTPSFAHVHLLFVHFTDPFFYLSALPDCRPVYSQCNPHFRPTSACMSTSTDIDHSTMQLQFTFTCHHTPTSTCTESIIQRSPHPQFTLSLIFRHTRPNHSVQYNPYAHAYVLSFCGLISYVPRWLLSPSFRGSHSPGLIIAVAKLYIFSRA